MFKEQEQLIEGWWDIADDSSHIYPGTAGGDI